VSAPSSGGNRFVPTADICAAIKGRETDLLDALGVPWRDGRPHVNCPYASHTDNNPSWRWEERKGRAYCTCITGSHSALVVMMRVEAIDFETAKIRAAELLGRSDLIRERHKKRSGRGTLHPEQRRNAITPAGCTLAAYAAAKQLPGEFLLSLGIREIPYQGASALRIPYFAAAGGEPAIRFRIALDGPDRFRWKKGSKPRLYGLERLAEARKAGSITIVEGESDCHTLWHAGFPAIGLPGAGNWNEERDAPLVDGISTIYLVVEPDQGGETALRWAAKSCIRDRVRLVWVDGFKDASALYLHDPRQFPKRWEAALDAGEPLDAIADREAAAEAQQAKEAAGDLILDPEILSRFTAELRRARLVGEDRNAKILYLALTTRLLDRPVSVAVKGLSGGGKSFIVEIVLKFFPPTAYFERTAMSDRALAYSDEDFRHRHLVIYEASGMTSDIASYLIRSLLSEGRIRYELVEKTKDGLKPRLIEKLGPTGLIVTTTAAKLHPENETRLLSLTVKDTRQQTAAILQMLARDQDIGNAVDYTRWQALQIALETDERRVVVPFANQLANLVPPVAVRLRRDFRMMLELIQAHALLHREVRERDDQGRIVAKIEDYAVVHELISDSFSEGIEATVAKTVRETVEAMQRLNKFEVSIAEIAKALDLDKSSVSRRVKVAISKGYLVNEETGKGKRARIATGDSMPDDAEILPHPDKLADRCTVAAPQEGMETRSPPADCDAELAEIEI
jgi:hypothetical protein